MEIRTLEEYAIARIDRLELEAEYYKDDRDKYKKLYEDLLTNVKELFDEFELEYSYNGKERKISFDNWEYTDKKKFEKTYAFIKDILPEKDFPPKEVELDLNN